MRLNEFQRSVPTHIIYFFWIIAWLAIVLVSWYIRPIAPIDETRYVGTAWEMWLNHNWIVLTVNGQIYGNKAPLLYWLILTGWKIFGVNNWWPRLVPALFSLGSLFALHSLAKKMSPRHFNFHWLAPTLLLGIFYWGFYTQRLMFDVPLIFFCILCYIGLIQAITTNSGWLMFILSLSVGILLKGPVIYLYVLFPAIFAPYWLKNESIKWGKWYFFILLSVIVSLSMLFTWIGLAIYEHGIQLGKNLFSHQIIGRMNGHFGHTRSWWYYFTILPGMLLPWFLWIPFWRSLPIIIQQKHTRIVRFCFSIILPSFLFFSFFVSTKQGRYILPIYPAVAVLFAYVFSRYPRKIIRSDQIILSLTLLLVGIGLILLPFVYDQIEILKPISWIKHISPFWGGTIFVLALFIWFFYKKNIFLQAMLITIFSVLLNLIYLLGVMHYSIPYYDLQKISSILHQNEIQGGNIANVGRYQDEFTFLGRLRKNVDEISSQQIKQWAITHPKGIVINFSPEKTPKKIQPQPIYWQPYRDKGILILWRSSQFNQASKSKT